MFIATNRMWLIRFFHRCYFFYSELDINSRENLFEMMCLGSADNRCSHARRLENPCTSKLSWRYSSFFCHLLCRSCHLIIVVMEIEIPRDLVRLRTFGWSCSGFTGPVSF